MAIYNPYAPNPGNYGSFVSPTYQNQYQQTYYNTLAQAQMQQNQPPMGQHNNVNPQMIYVHGIDGANAYQLPPGVNQQILWDDTLDMYYVKGYGANGIPQILAWNDYHPHVEDKKEAAPAVDMSNYPTKDDLKNMLASIDLSKFMTKEDFEREISNLSVGNGGRIVKSNA